MLLRQFSYFLFIRSIQNHTCFDDSVVLPFGTEYIYVACSEAETAKQFYKNVHAIIPKKSTAEHRNDTDRDEQFAKSVTTPNVLIVGVHSVSRLGLLRAMPETAKYLKDNGWAELVGYTKTGTDTFQNLVPLLTGLSYAQLTQQCWNSPFENFDDCPFIWKDFKRKSYVTAFAEDQAQTSAFNHHKYGFFNAPTDFYTRPFVLASERLLLDDHHGGIKFCLGPIPAAEHLLKYALDFAETFRNEPHFGFFWMDTFTKGDVNNPAVMDDRMKRFFLDLEHYLNSTFVLFLSDHGPLYGDIRQTYVGWLEERTPFNYLWIPPYFRRQFRRKYRNFSVNKSRLVSAFDLYLTLQDVLHNGNTDDDDDNDSEKRSNISAAGCKTCSSLFRTIGWDRTCEDAGIPSNWCVCEAEFISVPLNNYTIEAAAKFTVDYINRLLRSINDENGNSNGNCATLSLKRIISARRRLKFHSNTTPEYIVILETAPNNAIYEVTIKGQSTNNFIVIGAISRLNSHNPDSECATNSESAKYCTCAPKNE